MMEDFGLYFFNSFFTEIAFEYNLVVDKFSGNKVESYNMPVYKPLWGVAGTFDPLSYGISCTNYLLSTIDLKENELFNRFKSFCDLPHWKGLPLEY